MDPIARFSSHSLYYKCHDNNRGTIFRLRHFVYGHFVERSVTTLHFLKSQALARKIPRLLKSVKKIPKLQEFSQNPKPISDDFFFAFSPEIPIRLLRIPKKGPFHN